MRIGILGTGRLGSALALRMVRTGHQVVLANRRGPESLSRLMGQLGPGARAGSVAEVTAQDVIVLAVRWEDASEAIASLGSLKGKIVIDTTNPYMEKDGHISLIDIGDKTSSEVIAGMLPGVHVVKAFNTLLADMLGSNPGKGGGRRVIFYSGDDPTAKATVKSIIATSGWAPVDLGGLVQGGRLQQAGGSLAGLNLVQFT